jgi:hypothetical protein
MRAGVLCARTSVGDAVPGKHPQRVQPTILTERLFSKKGAEAFREHHVRACPMLQICGRVRDVQMRARTRRSGRLRASESYILLHMVIRKQIKQGRSQAQKRDALNGAPCSGRSIARAQMPAERMDTKTVPTKPGRSFPTMQPEHLRRTCTKAKKILSPVGLEPTQISLLECYLQ